MKTALIFTMTFLFVIACNKLQKEQPKKFHFVNEGMKTLYETNTEDVDSLFGIADSLLTATNETVALLQMPDSVWWFAVSFDSLSPHFKSIIHESDSSSLEQINQ